jgi:hypothetical protein
MNSTAGAEEPRSRLSSGREGLRSVAHDADVSAVKHLAKLLVAERRIDGASEVRRQWPELPHQQRTFAHRATRMVVGEQAPRVTLGNVRSILTQLVLHLHCLGFSKQTHCPLVAL